MNLRRYFPLILSLLLLLLVACGGGGTETAVTQPDPQATPPPTAPTSDELFSAPTFTPSPTSTNPPPPPTATPIPTDPPPTATPLPSPTYGAISLPTIEQPPYAESACSDSFPCNDDIAAWTARIRVPEGFEASYIAQLPSPSGDDKSAFPTSLTFGSDGLLYVATNWGVIYTINPDKEISIFYDGLIAPTGIAFQPGTNKLYLSSRLINAFVDGEAQVAYIENGELHQIINGLPCCYLEMHGPNGIAFGPDGYGYVGVGGRADHGEIIDSNNVQDELHPYEASILRFSPDGEEVEVYARGFRNPYDITWVGDQLFATDNGRDKDPNLENDYVPDLLHAVVPGGEHGYPYFECPRCFGIPAGIELVEPIYEFTPHSVATGIATYEAEQFPGYYGSMFTTLWTALPFAARVMHISPDGQTVQTFATGFSSPIDITVGPDGDLYIADFHTGIIFRISYTG